MKLAALRSEAVGASLGSPTRTLLRASEYVRVEPLPAADLSFSRGLTR